jgi:pimeloyl-ACP methyl ester carboxylesterase
VETIKANGLSFAYLEDGPADGPLALCLHGFPDSAHTFRHLLPALGSAGFHAVAPFMRGYTTTGAPPPLMAPPSPPRTGGGGW